MGESPDVPRAPAQVCCWCLDGLDAPLGVRRPRGAPKEGSSMPRYLVERTFPEGLAIPVSAEGAATCLGIVTTNADNTVTWLQSYVTEDKRKTYCVYEAPSPEAIRRAARRNQLPVDKIIQVQILDPYFYR